MKSLFATLLGSTLIVGPTYVLDADTVIVAGTHIRLKGVDAPELPEGSRPSAQ
jgi:endonuclease YncB( thermonuclease family)